MTTAETELAFLQYVLLFGVCMVFTLLAIARQKTIWFLASALTWFIVAVAHLAISPTASPLQSAPTYFYFGIGSLFFVFTFYHIFEDIKEATEGKKSVEYI